MAQVIQMARPSVAPEAIRDLLEMLTYMRPARSAAEAEFIKRFVEPLGTTPDGYGNHWRVIGKASPILWSCHTDTVHKNAGKQSIEYGDGYVTTSIGSCLGADCAAGVWLMARMIKAGIPGTYVFHREEETGGQGSDFIAKETPEKLAGLKYAIAFDRKGSTDIITHQFSGRTASDEFATSLSQVLGMSHAANDGGTFTDTANYAQIIPECSNLAVGYGEAHNPTEYLDCVYLAALLKAILKADWSKLVCARDPALPDPLEDNFWHHGDVTRKPGDEWASYANERYSGRYPVTVRPGDSMADIVYENPEAVAMFLEACGFTTADLRDYLEAV